MEGSKNECRRPKKTEKTSPDSADPRSKGVRSAWEALLTVAATDLGEAPGQFPEAISHLGQGREIDS